MLSSESVPFQESRAFLKKQILFCQPEIFSQSDLWKPWEYFVYSKDSKGSYAGKDRLIRKEDVSKECLIIRREEL